MWCTVREYIRIHQDQDLTKTAVLRSIKAGDFPCVTRMNLNSKGVWLYEIKLATEKEISLLTRLRKLREMVKEKEGSGSDEAGGRHRRKQVRCRCSAYKRELLMDREFRRGLLNFIEQESRENDSAGLELIEFRLNLPAQVCDRLASVAKRSRRSMSSVLQEYMDKYLL